MALFGKFNKDELINKAKQTASSVTDKAKSAAEGVKASMDEKKAEKEAYEAEMNQKAEERKAEILETLRSYSNNGSLFGDIDKNTLLAFTKNFYDKLLMPAMSVALSNISMHPYIEGKALEKVTKELENYDESETPILLVRAENKQFIFITDKTLYFVIALKEDAKFKVKGSISVDEISEITFDIGEETSTVSCDGYVFAEFKTNKTVKQILKDLKEKSILKCENGHLYKRTVLVRGMPRVKCYVFTLKNRD